ncbi:MAG TPA: D,D-dipeptide ABC transporter permease, partial [Rhodobacteraceae bacterium]|nr:D,D-dipeptide ABC transporter permease [Paracoccaceae bacterium]
MQKQTLREWLMTDTPTSRRHARFAALYSGWLTLKSN